MSLADRWTIGRELVLVASLIATDAACDLIHRSLPLSLSQLLDDRRGLRALLTARELATGL